MRFLKFLIIFVLLSNCSKPKTVLICGDHVCINKAEAEQFFEENLTLEVRVINKKTKSDIDLVELNLKEDSNGNKKVIVSQKQKPNQELKVLTNNEVNKIKKNIKNKKKEKKLVKKITENKKSKEKKSIIDTNESNKKKEITKKNVYKKDNVIDVCKLLKKCNIEEISKYLLEQGKKKDFPDITRRQ
tara:strand:- start:1164 stop:1724 length:561 start_codon:yes stop_codon:yes gene_type:complete